MKIFLLTSILCVSAISLSARQSPSPEVTPEGRVIGAPWQNVFAKAELSPMADLVHGEPAIAWHNGEFFLFYDVHPDKGPLCMMTSNDGVYWREEGIAVDVRPLGIECSDVRRFDPNGPFVLSYDVSAGDEPRRTWFSTSHDLRRWTRVPDVELLRDPKFYSPRGSYVQYSIPDPEGKGFYAVGAYAPVDRMGTGLTRSEDGIHWEQLPGIRVDGMVEHAGGLRGPMGKAFEASAVAKIGKRYFILGGSPFLSADSVVSSDNIRGPFRPTPKNSILLRWPGDFHRIYDLPQGLLSMPMLKIKLAAPRPVYHVAPFRRVVSDGESLWFRWWEGNEKLKVHALPASLAQPGGNNSPLRMIAEFFDLKKGLVLEMGLSLPAEPAGDDNWAASARVSADSTYSKTWWPEGYFAPAKAVDGRETTSWQGHRTAEKEATALTLDFGRLRPIGRVHIKWALNQLSFLFPTKMVLQISDDGQRWKTIEREPLRLPHANWHWEHLDLSARFLRVHMDVPPRRNAKNPADHVVGIAEVGVFPGSREKLDEAARGLFMETKPGEGYGWLIGRNGRVRFGEVRDGGSSFRCLRTRDLEVDFGDRAEVRIIQRDDIVDLYVNDYQVDYYQLDGSPLSGRFGLYSAADAPLLAWRPDPNPTNETKGTK